VLSRDRIVGEGPTTDVLSHPRGECTRAVAGAVTIPDLAIQRARRTQAAVKPCSSSLQGGEDSRSILLDDEGLLELSAPRTVIGEACPAVVPLMVGLVSQGEHRLDG